MKFILGFKANFNSSPGRVISSSALGYSEASNNYCISYPCKHSLFNRKQEKLMGIDCSSFLLTEKYNPLVAFKTRLVSFSKSK